MSRYVLTIDRWTPATVNELIDAHWRRASQLKRIDRNMIAGYVALNRIPPATGKRRVELTITRGESDPGRPVDPDNWFKSLLDALVRARMLIDDSAEWCEHRFIGTERGDRKATRIELIDLEE